jgi:hypothetical protein
MALNVRGSGVLQGLISSVTGLALKFQRAYSTIRIRLYSSTTDELIKWNNNAFLLASLHNSLTQWCTSGNVSDHCDFYLFSIIWGPKDKKFGGYSFLERDSLQSDRYLLKFQRNMLRPSSKVLIIGFDGGCFRLKRRHVHVWARIQSVTPEETVRNLHMTENL